MKISQMLLKGFKKNQNWNEYLIIYIGPLPSKYLQ